MNSSISTAIAAALALVAGKTWASPASYCDGNSNSICYSWGVPSSTASSGSGNIFLRFEAPTDYQWVAVGTGSGMSGSSMFVIYQDGSGNVTLSTRKGHGHNMAESNDWISAWMADSPLHSTDVGTNFNEHDGTGSFSVDFSKATVSSDSNPFTKASNTQPSSGSSDGAVIGGGGGEDHTGTNHGVIMSIVFLLGFPIGSLLMPVLGKWLIHAGWQIVVFAGMWVGFGIGKIASEREGNWFSEPHVQLGTIVCVLMIMQPVLGWTHHRNYVKYQRPTFISYGHLWYGRALMVVGIINGGIGLQLSSAPMGLIIAYAVIGVVVLFMNTAGAVHKEVKLRRSPKGTEPVSGRSASALKLI
ncbi:uncharacterized protein B0J16DRAFT_359157 [Fusarium flagelliforme]|uniref:uncharacterized protein n=1 Tax=Fusarium flagelliforme TaxID=2675880 RepID=UPI001E8D2375|nr:uncharacterized protein B0J16DRAFT_359157 [Fusarium flagelliforme]KAH7169850.1 hypothetical protein B0J16DRAFT_359157 [Fusarium flagelliforme]